MMKKYFISRAASLAIVAILATRVLAAPGESLDGATGNIFKVDLANHCFELLKETEYDPQTDLGASRFTVYWTDQTTISKLTEPTSFAGIPGPVAASFHGIDGASAKALAKGQPFVARVATLSLCEKPPVAVADDKLNVSGWFTPDSGAAPKSGTIEVNGKPVRVTLRKQNSRIYLREPVSPADIGRGFWKTTIKGDVSDDRFVIGSMEVLPLVDPRTTDDPKLPRVLVVGDSISMNYHDSAKAALQGVANYHRIEGNSSSTAQGVINMELWLGNYQEKGLHWDVIQLNHGLHDLKQNYDAASNTWGAYAVPLDDYRKNLEKEITILKKTGAKLIWCTTTPVPNDNKGTYARHKGAERIFNQAAMEVMRRHPEIQVNDLCQVVNSSPAFDSWRKGNNVHFKPAEQAVLGQAVAKAVRKALEEAPVRSGVQD